MTERERAEAEVAEKERALTDAFEAPGGDWYDVPPSMVREGFADTAEEGLRVLKDLLIGATIGADPSTRTEPVWDQPMDWQEIGEVGSLAMAPLAVGGRALLKRIAKPIRAFHGSPHVFEQPYRFDLDKIGTGEGSQAYGPGGYFAENLNVAKTYQPRTYEAEDILARMAQDAERAQDYGAYGVIEDAMLHRTPHELRAMHGPEFEELIKRIESLPQTGGLYEVDLHVRPESDLLDLDLRLSEQTPAARAKIQSILDEESRISGRLGDEPHAYIDRILGGGGPGYRAVSHSGGGTPTQSDMHGAGFVNWLGTALTPSTPRRRSMSFDARLAEEGTEAAKRLHRAGLSGSRYLDLGSREARQGTRDYVIWDPEVIDIRKKLAALLAVGGGATVADAFDQTPVEFGGQ